MSLVKLGKQETLNTALLSQQLSSAHTVHTEQQAASITAECQAGSCRSQANPTGVGRQEEKIRTQVPSPSKVASGPVHQVRLEHTHIPLRHLSFLLNTHSCPFPRVLVSVRPSVKSQEFIISQHLRLASASALHRPCTLRLLTARQGISLG